MNSEKEYYVELNGLSPHFVGRITLYPHGSNFNVEIDIVQSETGKIYNHVKSLHNQSDSRDAVDLAVYHLKKYLDSKLN